MYHVLLLLLLLVVVSTHRDQGKYKDAIRLLREVLEIREKCYGKNHQIVRVKLSPPLLVSLFVHRLHLH